MTDQVEKLAVYKSTVREDIVREDIVREDVAAKISLCLSDDMKRVNLKRQHECCTSETFSEMSLSCCWGLGVGAETVAVCTVWIVIIKR